MLELSSCLLVTDHEQICSSSASWKLCRDYVRGASTSSRARQLGSANDSVRQSLASHLLTLLW